MLLDRSIAHVRTVVLRGPLNSDETGLPDSRSCSRIRERFKVQRIASLCTFLVFFMSDHQDHDLKFKKELSAGMNRVVNLPGRCLDQRCCAPGQVVSNLAGMCPCA